MAKHKTGTREEWLKARLELLNAEKELTRRSDELARRRRSCRGSGSTRNTNSRPTRGAPRWQICSAGARSSSSITTCSGLTTRRLRPPARRSRTGSTASPCTWPTTTSRLRRCHGRRSRSCRRTSGGWGGRFPGVLVRRRVQPGFQCFVHRGATAQGRHRYNYEREPPFIVQGIGDSLTKGGEGPVATNAAMTGTDVATYTRERPG